MPTNIESINETSAWLLSLREIAAWQVEAIGGQAIDTSICALLPALQRGAVWSAAQSEALWDSLLRGFPIGSFLLAPFDEALGKQDFKLLGRCSKSDPKRTFHLLDGQQRATAIALGFFDLWGHPQENSKDGPALWVDLASPSDERAFVFRVLTRSHPWGYQSSEPTKRLSNQDIVDAMDCFRTVLGSGGDNIRSAGLPLRHAWPWDAACPLPVALLIESVAEGDKWRNALLNKLQALPMWSDSARLKKQQDGRQDDKQIQLKERWQDALKVEKTRNENSHSHRLELLAIALRRELQSQRIPGLILPGLETEDRSAPKDKESRKSAVETLFVRVNSAGTDLGGEELIYSLLKSAWPQAPDEIKKLQPNKRQVISPARMVTFLARLCDAWENGSLSEKMPGTPSVRDFRKTMRSDVKRKELLAFVNKVEPVIKDLLELVLYARPREPNGHDHRLPPTLAAQLFSGERGLDILLILSVWLMRLHKGQDGKTRLTDISLDKRQRTLGFVVAVNWFAEDAGLCFRRLWPTLRKYPAKGIEDFFNKSQFQSLLTVEPDGKLVMLPLVHPATLERLIGDRVVNGCSNYPGPNNENYWVASGKWIHYYERIVPENYANLHSGIKDWLSTIPLNSPDAQADNNNAAARDERRRFAWFRFIEKLWGNRRVVDYAQREQLMHWFSDFDPTLPGQMDDVNRPWDYDHIHPQSMGSSSSIYNLPAVIREWHTSIGNLRAWPLELNRGDQNSVPARKLDEITLDTRRFQLDKNKKLRRASFVGETKDWLDWKRCVPDPLENNRYLLDEKNKEYRVALITAITTRFCRLYRHWYKSLALGKLT